MMCCLYGPDLPLFCLAVTEDWKSVLRNSDSEEAGDSGINKTQVTWENRSVALSFLDPCLPVSKEINCYWYQNIIALLFFHPHFHAGNKKGIGSASFPALQMHCFFLQFLKKFYWSVVDLHCCVSFRCTVQWFSYILMCAHIHSFLDSFLIWVITEYWIDFLVGYLSHI